MREIKFRGKKKSDGNWIVGNYNLIDNRAYIFNHDAGGDNLNSPDDYEVIPETVGQFIGILDKEGVEIFEGDINNYGWVLKYGKYVEEDANASQRSFSPVLCEKYGWYWIDNYEDEISFNNGDITITGNIHEQKKQTP